MNGILTFIGKATITQQEAQSLEYLGRAIGLDDITLITGTRGEANQAIADGYAATGRVPRLKTYKVLDEITDGILVYADEELEALLDKHEPDWRTKDPIIVKNEHELWDYTTAALAAVKIAELTREHTDTGR